MRFLNPTGFLALLLALPIVLLYMLRLHRQDVRVPSLLLWHAVLADRHANRPWQKLRRNWLLLIQLLVLLALVFGLARPAVPAPMTFHGQVIILLDASASMQTRDDGETDTRFDRAVRELRDLAVTLDPDDRVALIAAGPVPRLLLQGGSAQDLLRAIGDLEPADGPADWRAAAALASGLAAGEDVNTVIVTDAAIDATLPALPGTVHLMTVGGDTANVGITAFALRRSGDGVMAFIRLSNAGPATTRTLALVADGALVERRAVDLDENGGMSATFADVPVAVWAEARLEEADALTVDDRAWVALPASGSGRVLLVSPENRFLAQALRVLPGLALSQSAELLPVSGEGDVGQDYAMLVVDGPVTTTLPVANMWLIAPGAGTLCGDPGDVFTPTTGVRGRWTHPLLHYVNWNDVYVSRARFYTAPPDADVLLETAAGPLLWTVKRPGQRVACTAFDLHDSNLPLRLAFPILTANLVGWLMPTISVDPIVPHPAGFSWEAEIPAASEAATLVTPDGQRLPLSLDVARTMASDVGLYQVDAQTSAGTVVRYAALSLLNPAESDVRPREVRVGARVVPPDIRDAPGWRDVSRWAIAAALVLLLVEAALWWGRSLRHGVTMRRDLTARGGFPESLWSRFRDFVRQLRGTGPLLLRLSLFILLLLALIGARWSRRTRDLAVVFLLDRSASTREAWDAQVAFVEAALARKMLQDRAALVVFGGDAWVDRPLSPVPELAVIATLPRADATDIEAAVRLGLALIPEGAPGRLVVLTDGLETSGAATWAFREAQARHVEVQVVQSGRGTPDAEAWIADLRLPTRVYPGDRVPVTVDIRSNTAQSLRLTWTAGAQTGQVQTGLTSTDSAIAFAFDAGESGFVSLRACLEPERDTFVQNNCADGWVMVQGAPRILVVGVPEDREPLVQALERAGLVVETALPENVPLTVQALADYAGLVVVNTPARAFAPQSLEALQGFVRDLGGGLVAVGGPQSYGVGGWLGTPLEEVLPVEMRVQDPSRFPPLAMAVVIDKSGSMGAAESGTSKIRLAAEAAIRVAETLNDTDTLAVVAFDDRPADTFGPVTMDQREALISRLRRLQAGGGGIYVRESLAYAEGLLGEVELLDGTQRHILLLADGADAEHQDGVLPMAEDFVADGMTVSVVSIGGGSDVPFLARLAETGQGRFYLTQRAADLPAIFAEEAARAKRSYIVEETFYPTPVSTWAPVAGVAVAPPLRGYVAATPKGTAQVVWEATQGDPLLAVWQYGLGRSVAWTSDASGRWAAEWVAWDGFAEMWGAVVRHVLPSPADTGLAMRVFSEGDTARVIVDVAGYDATGSSTGFVDGLDLALQIVPSGGDGQPQTLTLDQRAPGRYEARFALPGRDALLLRLYGDRDLVAGWSPPTSPEYVPGDAEVSVARMVVQGGGVLATGAEQVFVRNLRGRDVGQSLAPVLLTLAALLWPLDIAWRRLALTRSDFVRIVATLRGWLVRGRRGGDVSSPATPPTLAGSLRQRREREAPVQRATPPVAGDGRIEDTSPPADVRSTPPVKPASRGPAAPEEGDTLASRLKRRMRE